MNRSLNRTRVRKSIVIVVALSGALLDGAYAIGSLLTFFDPQSTFAAREILVPAISLDLGWAALLLWTALKPFERRAILLIAVLPLLLANLLTGANQVIAGRGNARLVAINTLIGLAYASLYLVAYRIGNPAHSGETG